MSYFELGRGGREQQLTIEQQQQLEQERERERQQNEREQLPGLINQIDKELDKNPQAKNAFNQLPKDEQDKLKTAIAREVIKTGGKNPQINYIGISKKDGSLCVMSNQYFGSNFDLDTYGRQPTPARSPTPEQSSLNTPEKPGIPDIDPQDPERLKQISQQLDSKLQEHLRPYSYEQSEQIKQALTKELSELTGKNLHIDQIDTIEDAKLKITYNRDQTLIFDPNEYLANQELEQQLQQPDIPEDPHLLAYSQIREQTEQQLGRHLSQEELNSLQQNILITRVSEAIQQLGGDNANISQINPLEDGRLQIQLEGQRTELRVSPEALLAEQGLLDHPAPEGLAGIQTYRPGLDGPAEYTIQKGEGPVHIGKALFPDDQRLAQAASEVGLYNLQDQGSARHKAGQTNRYITQIGDKASVDLSQYSEQDIDKLASNFSVRMSTEHQRDVDIQRVQAERAALQRQQAQEQTQQKEQEKQNSLFKPFTQSISDVYGQDGLGQAPAGNRFNALTSLHGVTFNPNRLATTQNNAAGNHTNTTIQTSTAEANWQYSQGLGKGALETGKDMLIGAATIASDTFWGAGNILTGGIFNNTDFMQGVVQRNNALYEGLYQTAGELTGKFMYYGVHPDEAVKDTRQTISDYQQQREVLFTQGQYEEAGRRDGKLGTEAALFAAPAVVGAVKLARGVRAAEVGRVLTAKKVAEAELSFERTLNRSKRNVAPETLLTTSEGEITKFSGHGGFEIGKGMVTVPEDTSVTVFSSFGSTITDGLGNVIETGGDISQVYRRTYSAGEKMPNYTLYPPDGLNIKGKPITVTQPTDLKELIKSGMGECHWAACTFNTKAKNANLLYDTQGILNTELNNWVKVYTKE